MRCATVGGRERGGGGARACISYTPTVKSFRMRCTVKSCRTYIPYNVICNIINVYDLHGQVLPHRLHLLPEVDVLLLAALVAKLNQPAADPVDRLGVAQE